MEGCLRLQTEALTFLTLLDYSSKKLGFLKKAFSQYKSNFCTLPLTVEFVGPAGQAHLVRFFKHLDGPAGKGPKFCVGTRRRKKCAKKPAPLCHSAKQLYSGPVKEWA
jgi:hypothetical protein